MRDKRGRIGGMGAWDKYVPTISKVIVNITHQHDNDRNVQSRVNMIACVCSCANRKARFHATRSPLVNCFFTAGSVKCLQLFFAIFVREELPVLGVCKRGK